MYAVMQDLMQECCEHYVVSVHSGQIAVIESVVSA